MTVPLRENDLLSEFDRRHKAGLIFYDSNPQIQLEAVNGFQFELVVTAAISKKPYIKDNGDEPSAANPAAKRPPGYALGSDIDVSGYEIGDVTATHLLAFNKFCMYRPHMLLLTKDGFRRQYNQLDVEDIQAAWKVLEALNWSHFMFFNCGKDGGCSRLHKHLQLAPFLPDRLIPWPESGKQPANIPYEYVLRRFDADLGPKQVADVYEQMIEEARAILGTQNSSDRHVPHNVVLGRNWILVIPRRKGGVGGAYANALGMLGMVSVASKDELQCWIDQGLSEVVAQLGVPKRVMAHDGMKNGFTQHGRLD
ncbi:hypothetical protein JX265_007407 [Neoarthrinium moseri]|uniref:ATP adenylyltransferase n=1 Tax=Neoarthrinium moseri TaxID=1658444 RepID=A0A9Q0APM7_9PEZI|nr:uncharacterized protein JN550_009130 [Neoarthrinium moseri]KAI1843621.1 hypothetical protein JX266_010254 [Neoarthrinium moseri]KAI1864110.1 hypothetical protein JN550_009130 [Neoarthrinium moseri]KAI1867605.1 hypothetical protein JX265_007407 [Neoarthrinium moseri]